MTSGPEPSLLGNVISTSHISAQFSFHIWVLPEYWILEKKNNTRSTTTSDRGVSVDAHFSNFVEQTQQNGVYYF